VVFGGKIVILLRCEELTGRGADIQYMNLRLI